MKLPLKNIITVRIVLQKVLTNVLEEAKLELPSMFRPENYSVDHTGLSVSEIILLSGIVVLGLSLISRNFEIKGESKLKPFVDASQIHLQIKYALFVTVLLFKYFYYGNPHPLGNILDELS